jgi:hypothetical protein
VLNPSTVFYRSVLYFTKKNKNELVEVEIELRIVQFWSKIMIRNYTPASPLLVYIAMFNFVHVPLDNGCAIQTQLLIMIITMSHFLYSITERSLASLRWHGQQTQWSLWHYCYDTVSAGLFHWNSLKCNWLSSWIGECKLCRPCRSG